MCSKRGKNILNHVNRVFIGSAGIAGTLLDGFHSGDLFCIVSIVVWLMQAEFIAFEERIIACCKQTLA